MSDLRGQTVGSAPAYSLCKTRSATVHNLNVAQSYFSHNSDAHTLSRLIDLVGNMSDDEFERWYKKITSESMV